MHGAISMVLRYQLTNLQRFYLQRNVSLFLSNQTIEVMHQFIYLGIIFQDNGLFNAHVSYVHEKCLKRMLKGTNWGVSKDPLFCIYRALIRAIIE